MGPRSSTAISVNIFGLQRSFRFPELFRILANETNNEKQEHSCRGGNGGSSYPHDIRAFAEMPRLPQASSMTDSSQ